MKKLAPEKKAMIRRVFSHALLIGFLALVLVPYIMVVSASFRRGNFAPNSLLPDHFSLEHWKYVLGIPYEEVINPATGEKRMVEAETPLCCGSGIRSKYPPLLRSAFSCYRERPPTRSRGCTSNFERLLCAPC
jgi:hypothetical protein